MRKPTVHINGTSRLELLSQYRTALDAGRKFQEALEKAAPHGRDYYPQDSDATSEAWSEHNERRVALQKILDDLEQLALHVTEEN